jgi:hypothetical protein
MAQVTVTVNGQNVKEYTSAEHSREIADFYRSEMRTMGRVAARHVTTSTKMRNVSKVEETGNGHIRCA